MLKRWKNRVKNNDGPTLSRLSRKLCDNRASVFLEFAFAMPLLMMVSLFILEICLFWDTTIMANHAAFSLSRIAKVNCYHGLKTDSTAPYPKINLGSQSLPADQVVGAFYMMTSTFSWLDGKSSSSVNFIDFFKIEQDLISVSIGEKANLFEKLIGSMIQTLVKKADDKLEDALNKAITEKMGQLFSGDFGKEMNTRFNMALQRTQNSKYIVTSVNEINGITGPFDFPSDDANKGTDTHPSGNYADPEIVKVEIKYPLQKGGWLYTIFSYWGKQDQNKNEPVALGTHSMLVEPAKSDLPNYHANDDGDMDIDPAELRKEAKKRVAKIATYVEKWQTAVKLRVNYENQHGGRDNVAHDTNYQALVNNELQLWETIVTHIKSFEDFMKASFCRGSSDGQYCKTWFWFHHHCAFGDWGTRCDYTNCARPEYQKAEYCSKISPLIKKTAGDYGLFWGKSHSFPTYVNPDYVNPVNYSGCGGLCH